MRFEKSVFYGDFHAPYEDPWCVKIAEQINLTFKPQYIFLLGDVCDFYQLSKFDKDPQRINCLQQDIDAAIEILERMRTSAPKAKIVFFEGNHENRLWKYLWKNPELASLKALTIQSLLKLDKFDIQFVGSLENYLYHSFCIEHGNIVRKWSAYTARGMMENRGVSGISGHTHRLGSNYLTNLNGDFVWYENGCMCDRNPFYLKNANWQNGLSVGYFRTSNGRFTVEQVCIPDGKCVFHGKEFGREID